MPQQSLALRWGYSDGTTIKVVAHSLSSADVVVTVSGVSPVTFSSMTGVGTVTPLAGKTEAFFAEGKTISGLSAFTTYTYTAVQGANSITGSFTTTPSINDDFAFFVGTCDNISSLGGSSPGMYEHIRSYMQTSGNLPVVGLLHLDDHYGYMDFNGVDDSAGTGHKITAGDTYAYETATDYNYALGAGAALGLYSASGNAFCTDGHDADRVWCMQNLPVWPQKGDHDCGKNEMGWSTATDGVGLPSTQYDNSLLVWNAILKPLQPPAIDGSNSNAWGATFGPVYIAAMDGITQASGDGTDYTAAPADLFGSTQISSVLSAMNNSSPFKILGLSNGIRYLNADNPHDYTDGAQNPIELHATEYPALFTDAGSLMGMNATNGAGGTFFTMHGDYHGLKAQKNERANGTNAEWFYSFNVGTLTGATNFPKIAADTVYNGSTVEYSEGVLNNHDYWCARVEVYGSRYPRECHVILMDKTGADVWSKKFVSPRGGNDAHAIPADLSLSATVMSGDAE